MKRVIRLGGSVFDDPRTCENFWRWLQPIRHEPSAIIIGGGASVEALRLTQKARSLSDLAAHKLALEYMSVNARAAQIYWPELPFVEFPPEKWPDGACLCDVAHWALGRDEELLPRDWRSTSDSIAALAATAMQASELVLLKSCLPQRAKTYAAAAKEGYVDKWFPRAARDLNVRCINACDKDMPEMRLRWR